MLSNPFDTLIQLAEKAASGELCANDRSALESAAASLGLRSPRDSQRSSFGFYSNTTNTDQGNRAISAP
jgi:hypothetical protein